MVKIKCYYCSKNENYKFKTMYKIIDDNFHYRTIKKCNACKIVKKSIYYKCSEKEENLVISSIMIYLLENLVLIKSGKINGTYEIFYLKKLSFYFRKFRYKYQTLIEFSLMLKYYFKIFNELYLIENYNYQ